mgnify:CR=1 FL=1
MSQEIDQRVVEMRFDNAQFEKNSRDTMRTLDKLKEKLSFKGAAKGLEQVQAASEAWRRDWTRFRLSSAHWTSSPLQPCSASQTR